MTKLTYFLTVLCILMALALAWGAYEYYGTVQELNEAREYLVLNSNQLREARQELGYWNDMLPLIKQGMIPDLQEQIRPQKQSSDQSF